MSKVSRASFNTTLKIGLIETPVGLYKTVGDTKGRKWELANSEGNPWSPATPSGGVPPAPPADPLGEEPKPEQGSLIGGAVPPAGDPPAGEEEAPKEPEKPRKGIRKDDGEFVDLTSQIEEIGERTKLERMEVVSFIDRAHVPRERITAAYYVGGGSGPGLPPGRLLKILTEAMRRTRKVAVVRFTKRKGQTLGVITPYRGEALLLLELCFAEQFREPNGKCLAHTKADVNEGEIAQATGLILAMASRRESLDSITDLRAAMEEELGTRALEGELDDFTIRDQAVDADTEKLGNLLESSVGTAQG